VELREIFGQFHCASRSLEGSLLEYVFLFQVIALAVKPFIQQGLSFLKGSARAKIFSQTVCGAGIGVGSFSGRIGNNQLWTQKNTGVLFCVHVKNADKKRAFSFVRSAPATVTGVMGY
jgi:hypothetical protein